MTKRREHNRTNRYGKTFTVREHTFNAGRGSVAFRLTWKNGEARINGSVTYQMTCPQCRQDVFFYRNENGSRVFFDHLGAPWPKHGCMHGVRKMEGMPITAAQPVKKNSKTGPKSGAPQGSDVFVDIGSVKEGVGEYNREVRRAIRDAMGLKNKRNKRKKK